MMIKMPEDKYQLKAAFTRAAVYAASAVSVMSLDRADALLTLVFATGIAAYSAWNTKKKYGRRFGAMPELDEDHHIVQAAKRFSARAGVKAPSVRVQMGGEEKPLIDFVGTTNQYMIVNASKFLNERNLSEEEKDGTIAHEIAHIEHRDVTHGQIDNAAYIALCISTMGMAAEQVMQGRIAQALLSSSILPLVVLASRYVDRQTEYSADQRGFELTDDKEALISGFRHFNYVSGEGELRDMVHGHPIATKLLNVYLAINEIFSEHPMGQKRIAALEEYSKVYKPS